MIYLSAVWLDTIIVVRGGDKEKQRTELFTKLKKLKKLALEQAKKIRLPFQGKNLVGIWS